MGEIENEANGTTKADKKGKKAPPGQEVAAPPTPEVPPTVLAPMPLGDLRNFALVDFREGGVADQIIGGIFVPQLILKGNFVQLVGFRGIVLTDSIVRLTAPLFARKPEKEEGYVQLKPGDHLLVPDAPLAQYAPRVDFTGEHVFEIAFLPLGRISGEWKYQVFTRKLSPAEVADLGRASRSFTPTNLHEANRVVKSLL